MAYNPVTEGYIIDAPWRIDSSVQTIPILAIANDPLNADIHNIYVLDHNNGDNVVASTNWANKQVITANNKPFFYLFNLNKDLFVGNPISVKIKFDLESYLDNEEGPIYIYKSSTDLPTLSNWYVGDTHYHTNYSRNLVEYGAPIRDTKEGARALGLDWITITDHSFDLKAEEWPLLKAESSQYTDTSFVFIPGEEVSTNEYIGDKYRHYLALGINNYIDGIEIDPGFPFAGHTPPDTVNLVKSYGGSGYIAHPYLGHTVIDDPFRQPWKDAEYNLDFTGLQFWNYETVNGDDYEFNAGYEKWKSLLKDGRHVYVSGGSDAHGDFNTNLGKVRTYVYTEQFNQQGILTALKNGNSFMTNGPFVTFKIDNAILGQTVSKPSGSNPTLNIQWASTPEFGAVNKIEIWRNNATAITLNLNSLSGTNSWTDSTPVTSETYYRLVAYASGDYRAYTNPIWVKPNQGGGLDDGDSSSSSGGGGGGGSSGSDTKKPAKSEKKSILPSISVPSLPTIGAGDEAIDSGSGEPINSVVPDDSAKGITALLIYNLKKVGWPAALAMFAAIAAIAFAFQKLQVTGYKPRAK
ncbi:TPA: PHP domain-containing protein [archaeon]|nr:PHP domain-containing protein [Candidatus Naiadarchaeales archaeon SRR2090153.bin461]